MLEVSIAGMLQNAEGKEIPVRYEQTYAYHDWGMVRVRLTLTIEQPLDSVYEIGVAGFSLARRVDVIGLRPGLPPPPPAGHYHSAEAPLEWHELMETGSYRQQYAVSQGFIPSYFCAFQKGMEGLEFWRGDDGASWDQPFGIAPGQAAFVDDSYKSDDIRPIRLEPFCNWAAPRSFAPGTITWDYALGLPFVKENRLARKLTFHAGIASRDWPADDTLKRWADAGVSLIRLHDDDSSAPTYWRNCLYPPYDSDNMKMLDHVIEQCHRLGLKILPYFSLKHYHWDCPDYAVNAEQWKRWVGAEGAIAIDGPYGGYMCMKSGWLDFKKQTIDLVLRNHAFDGVYYDHMWYRFCRHPGHGNGHWHTDSDEVLEFMRWTRERVGRDGTVFIHTSGCPGMVFENLSDLVFIGEDMPHVNLAIGGQPPDLPFVPIAPRNWVPAGRHFVGEGPEARRSFFIALLEGCPTSGAGQSYENLPEFVIRQFAQFAPYDLSQFEFWRASEKPVRTGHRDVHAALLVSPSETLVYCANFGDQDCCTTLHIAARRAPGLSANVRSVRVSIPKNDALLIRVGESAE